MYTSIMFGCWSICVSVSYKLYPAF